MTNLIKVEIYKLMRNKTFLVLIGTITGVSALLHCLILMDWWLLSGTEFDKAGLSEFNALSPFTLSLFFNLIVSTLAGFSISTEFTQGAVIKNQLVSGHTRTTIYLSKYMVFTLGAFTVTILLPLLTAIMMVLLVGQGDLLSLDNLMYLGRAYGLFSLQFLSFTAIVLWIAIATEDSGKTILFTLLLSVIVFVIEKLITAPFIIALYANTFFYQFSEVFKVSMTSSEMLKSTFIGVVSVIIMIVCGVFMFNRKEIK